MDAAVKKHFACAECAKKTSSTDAKRAKTKLCAVCAPDIVPLPAHLKKPAKASRTAEAARKPAKGRRTVAKLAAIPVAVP